MMAFAIGVGLAAGVAGFARASGFDRDRAYYATITIVIASYYVLFALIDGNLQTLTMELAVMAAFTVLAVAGFRRSQLLIAIAIAGHGLFDAVHGLLVVNQGMPEWWPAFC